MSLGLAGRKGVAETHSGRRFLFCSSGLRGLRAVGLGVLEWLGPLLGCTHGGREGQPLAASQGKNIS